MYSMYSFTVKLSVSENEPHVAMGWPIVSDSFVPRLLSYSCLRTEQLQGEIYPVETKTDSPITLELQEIFK